MSRRILPLLCVGTLVATVYVPRVVRCQDEPLAPPVKSIQVFAGGEGNVVVTSSDGEVPLISYGVSGGIVATPLSMSFAMPADPTSLLNMEQIQQELELLDGQLEQIREIQTNMRKRQSELVRRVSPDAARQPDVAAAMQDELKELRSKARDEIEQLLLPHQSERLQQISRRMALQRQGTAAGITGDALAEELGLTDEQKERLRERGKEIEEDVKREIARLRKEAEEKLLAELTPPQRDKLKKLLGEEFEVKPRSQPAAVPPRVSP
jgi:hypothetical protein